MTNHVFYHADLDGSASAAIAFMNLDHVILHKINYGWPFPWDEIKNSDTVYMLDFGLQPFDNMIRLDKMCQLIWIDHHISAIEESRKVQYSITGIQEIGQAGCELTWKYFCPGRKIPTSIQLLGRYDVWDHENFPNAMAFHCGMKYYDPAPDDPMWKQLFDDSLKLKILKEGKLFSDYQRKQNLENCGRLFYEIEFEGLPAICANTSASSSLFFDGFYDPSKHKLMIPYVWDPRAGKWTVSLYTTHKDVHVGNIAKSRGGGGHKGAAGFQCDDVKEFIGRKNQ